MPKMEIYDKQEIIDNLINYFINFKPYEKEDGSSRTKDEVALVGREVTLKVCEDIDNVMSGDYFLPRYYKLSNYLFKEYNDLDNKKEEAFGVCSRLKNVHKKATDFLLEVFKLYSQKQLSEPLLVKYCMNLVFRHHVDEFFSSVMHEILIYESYIAGAKSYLVVNDINQIKALLPELEADFKEVEKISREKYEKAKETLNAAENGMKGAKKAFEDANQACNEYKSILPNLIAVIGIFIAIIIAIIAVVRSASARSNG